jgi:hypothetical protein
VLRLVRRRRPTRDAKTGVEKRLVDEYGYDSTAREALNYVTTLLAE